ncbi:hypothetical protein AMECASPLE_000476 [Ameca splendens]|uniref:Uncharacterized protein n=1 Tax=Ameca splendens TaxID=208324 RepID=A0ABV1A4Y7_9TELE
MRINNKNNSNSFSNCDIASTTAVQVTQQVLSCLDGSRCFSKTCMYLSALVVPSQMYTDVHGISAHAMSVNTAPYHHRCWLLNIVLISVHIVLFLFGPEDTTSMIYKNIFKLDPSDHSTFFHFASVHLRCAHTQRRRRHFWVL